jgi:hypothetical protein
MNKESKAAQGSAAAATGTRFKDMGLGQKVVFLGKACLFFLTLGFAYPNIFLD